MSKNRNSIAAIIMLLGLTSCLLSAVQFEEPTVEDIAKCIRGEIDNDQKEIHVIKWMLQHPKETLPIAFSIEEDVERNPFTVSAKYGTIKACTTNENAQSIIDRLVEPDTSDVAKTTALEIAEKYGFKGERYRKVLIDVLTTTEYGGLQERLLKLLQTYGREEDAELALGVFKKTDNRHIKSVASDTLLAIGGPEIIEPWEEELARLREAEPARQRKKREKEERMAEEIGVELPPRRPSKFIDSIDGDIQSLKEKVAAQEAGRTQEENPKSSSQGGGEEGDAVRAPSTGGQSDTGSKSARPWRSFPIVLAGMIALAVLIALARKKTA